MVFDLIVIGSGPAGQKAALQAAKLGKKVAIIEEAHAVGGGCVHTGTLPSKSFRESVYRWSLGSRGTLGQEKENAITAKKNVLPDMQRLLRRKHRVVSAESQIIFDQLKRNNVTVYQGRASFLSANDVEVKNKKSTTKLTGSSIIIAVGARPVSTMPVNNKTVFDSNSVLNLKNLPKTLVVLGGGIIGCEYASMFATAGTRVYLVDRRHEILAAVDREIVNRLTEMFLAQGMEIVLEAETEKIETKKIKGGKGVRVFLSNGRRIDADAVLVAQGRQGNIDHLCLEKAGVKTGDRGLIPVDEHYCTNIPHIYAVGDVIGPPALASTSMEQGRLACRHAFQVDKGTMSEHFPYGIYTIPEISMVGKTEEQLLEDNSDFVVGRSRYRELARGQIVGDRWGVLKLLVDKKTFKLLGVHILGDSAADLIHIGQAVMDLGGDVYYFIRTVFNYPTLAEAYKTAAFHAVNQIKQTK
jgi:NAD(P) transhydrogenase